MSENKILTDLVRCVARAFYPDECHVVLDELMRVRKKIEDEMLAQNINMHTKLVRSALAMLKSDLLVKSDMKFERDPKTNRSKQLELWYIDYRQFVHAVRFRMYKIDHKLETQRQDQLSEQLYVCTGDRCKRRYTSLEANNIFNPKTLTFNCKNCHNELELENNEDIVEEIELQKTRMLEQLKPIREQLRLTEGTNFSDQADDDAQAGHASHGSAARGSRKGSGSGHPAHGSGQDAMGLKVQIVVKMNEEGSIGESNEPAKGHVPEWWDQKPAEQAAAPHNTDADANPAVDADTLAEYAKAYQEAVRQQALQMQEIQAQPMDVGADDDFEDMSEGDDDDEDPWISAGNDMKRLSEITQADIDKMTPDQNQVYADFAEMFGSR